MASSFLAFATERFESEITPVLEEYIAIPAKSPHFEPAWAELGHIDRAVRLLDSWARSRPIAGLRTEVVTLPGRTPVLLLEIPAFGVPASADAVLLYGHLDKQPEMVGWDADLGPWKPVRRGDRLYGRGGADDGYAIFASLTAIEAVQASGGQHVRCVVLIEACEESGSYDLPHYVEHLLPRIGTPSLVVCLDSGAGDYERLWMTTSLRGLVAGTLTARVLDQGVHSGDASGVVPSSFRVLRQLLDRIEDAKTGRFLLPSFHTEVPPLRREQAGQAARLLGDTAWKRFPWAGGTQPMSDDPTTIALARTWTPMLSITGAEGLPAIGSAGNVLRPETALKLSVR
ncbi:MAG: M20/M25/M40 family metallo-hydrolase, partial [Myxococcales bacterium]